jgi:hypothetical protein
MMSRFTRLAFSGALCVFAANPIPAQQQSQQVQAQQKAAQQIQAQKAAQQAAQQALRNQAAEAQRALTITQTPWFAEQNLRNQLRLTDDQFNRLNTAYGQQWNRYNTAQGQLGTLSDQQRTQREQELSGAFYKDFGQGTNDVLQPEQRQRFNQLGLQYRGYDAFNDPAIRERLRLTDRQLELMRRQGEEYGTRLGEILKNRTGTDQDAYRKQFEGLQKEMHARITTVLTEEQRAAWRELTGEPYDFPAPASSAPTKQTDPSK